MEKLLYNIKLSLKNISRSPLLYGLMCITLAVGVGLLMANLALIKSMASDPVPHLSHKLYHVSLNVWPNTGAHQQPFYVMRHRDAMHILDSDIPSNKAVFYVSANYVRDSESTSLDRINATMRATNPGFFELTRPPFKFGQGFTSSSGTDIVIGHDLNMELYGGENSVGRRLEIDGALYTIVGVLDEWDLRPMYYHATDGRAFMKTDDLFMPLETAIDNNWYMHARASSTQGWSSMQDTRDKHVFYLQTWVELETQQQVDAFQQYLDDYSQMLKDQGIHPLDIKNELNNVNQWLEKQQVVDQRILAFAITTLAFLVVCIFNASSLLLAKYHAGTFETSLRRALGASKKEILWLGLTESTLVGTMAGVLVLILSWVFLKISTTVSPLLENIAVLEADMLLYGFLLAVITANLSSLYPLFKTNNASISALIK